MDIIDEALDKVNCKERYFVEGNHDDWLNRFVEEHPYLKDMRFKNAVKLCDRGYKYYPIGKLLKVGKLNRTHESLPRFTGACRESGLHIYYI